MFGLKNTDFADYYFYGISVFKNKCKHNFFFVGLNNFSNRKASVFLLLLFLYRERKTVKNSLLKIF